MAKWVFYVLVFVYMCYRAVYGARVGTGISVEQISYGDNGYLEANTRQTVNCKASNRNQKVEWIDPFGIVVKRIPSNRVYAQEQFVSSPKGGRAPGLVLTFTDLLVSDSGIYQCKSGEQTKSVPVCVIKPSQFVDTPGEVTVEEGRSISLSCQAKGDPEPQLIWKREGEELVEGDKQEKYRVNRKYNSQGYESFVTITSLAPEDAGLYTCVSVQESPMLDNCTHYDAFNVTLRVEHAPKIKGGNITKYVYGKSNEVVNLNCEARGWPKPTYRWFKVLGGDALYEFDKTKISFSEDESIASIPVTAAPTTFGNVYKCTATNSFGEMEKYFNLLKRDKPWRASAVDKMYVTGTTIYFNVTWDDQIYFPVNVFEFQYIEKSKLGDRQPDKSDWDKADQFYDEIDEDEQDKMLAAGLNESGTVLVTRLDGLEPDTEYVVRLRATNAAGNAPWSDPVTATTLREPNTSTEDANANTDANPETEANEPESKPVTAVDTDSGMFYGIFFTGGILIIAVVCTFVMRLV